MKHVYIALAISIGILLAIFFLESDIIPFSPSKPSVSKVHTVLRFSPSPIMTSSESGKADIEMDTGEDTVSLIQVKLSYNPHLVYDIQLKKSEDMSEAEELNNFIDAEKGTATFILNIPKEKKGFSGKATLAEFSFKTHLRDGDRTNVSFMKETIVTDSIAPYSFLEKTENTQIIRKDN